MGCPYHERVKVWKEVSTLLDQAHEKLAPLFRPIKNDSKIKYEYVIVLREGYDPGIIKISVPSGCSLQNKMFRYDKGTMKFVDLTNWN